MSGGKHGAVDVLAEYLTGPSVTIHSMGLVMAGAQRTAAEQYFAMRAALGVFGYVTAGEARAAIAKATGAAS